MEKYGEEVGGNPPYCKRANEQDSVKILIARAANADMIGKLIPMNLSCRIRYFLADRAGYLPT